jgi:hypothetical protein
VHLLQVAALAGHVEANFLMGHSEAQVGGRVGSLSAAAFRSTPPIADVAYNVLFAKPIL